jgi:hypothetical protein
MTRRRMIFPVPTGERLLNLGIFRMITGAAISKPVGSSPIALAEHKRR